MRPIISYDDITDPGTQPAKSTNASPAAQLGPQIPSNSNQPPTKRRKTNQKASRQQQQRSHQYVQHWDDPAANIEQMNYDDVPQANTTVPYDERDEYEEVDDEEESKELTHEEIWDDSALIEAWDSANAEYEAYHGGKNWKNEPMKKSPLWYNVPTSPSKSKKSKSTVLPISGNQNAAQGQHPVNAAAQDGDSKPLNFDTFVPDHDPSLLAGTAPPHPPEIPGPDYAQYYMPNPPGPMVSQDEAFQRALSAMYWGGYWTAVYHCQRQTQNGSYDEGAAGNYGEEEDEVEVDEDENENENVDMQDLVSTQR